jgi:hypothetical protein
VFTSTTRFEYDGLGARTSVEVVGYDTTTVTLDYAAGSRILAETTITGTTLYLYGRDCLGQYGEIDAFGMDAELGLNGIEGWLYYLNDGNGLTRQGTDETGRVVGGKKPKAFSLAESRRERLDSAVVPTPMGRCWKARRGR